MRTGYPWMPQIAGRPTANLFKYARRNGATTALDMSNPDRWQEGMLERLVSEVIPNVDLLCANERELYKIVTEMDRLEGKQNGYEVDNSELKEYLLPERMLDYADGLLSKGVKIINLHYGEKGTMLITSDYCVFEEALRADNLINPTGTGNLQNAGVIYCMLNGRDMSSKADLSYTAKFANAAAMLRLSGIDFPSLQEVEANIK